MRDFVRIGAFCKTGSGGTPSRQRPEFYGGTIPWVKSGELREDYIYDSEEKITERALELSSAKLISKGSILVALYGATVGRMAMLGVEAATNQAVCHIQPDEALAFPKYVYYALRAKVPEFLVRSFGGAQPNISQGVIRDTQIYLPPLAEQKRIAAILDKADTLRQKRKESLKLLDEFIRSVFLEMFGDPVVNPKGWDKKRLTNCVIGKAQNGYFAKSDSYGETGTPIIWISDFIDKFYVDVTNIKRVTTSPEDIVRYEVNYGDVLFCRSSLNVEGIGKASIIPRHLPENTIYECHAIKISLNKKMLLPEFFRVQSNTEGFRMGIMQRAKTATMTTISQDGILDSSVIVPPIERQHKFTRIVERCLTIYKNAQQSSRELDNQFNSLVQRAFRGEL